MKFRILKDNYEILTLEDYREYAGPVKKGQWKDKRSAKEFARYLLSNAGQLPAEMDNALNSFHESGEVVLYPEYLTGFNKYEMGYRGPRHHDGLLVGSGFVAGIEAKADEPLDQKYLSEYDPKKARYQKMSEYLFGDGPESHADIRYQLCSASMATMIEAVERKKENAILLIISFLSEEGTDSKNVETNKQDIASFKNALIDLGNDQYETPFSKEHGISFFIKTIEIDLDK